MRTARKIGYVLTQWLIALFIAAAMLLVVGLLLAPKVMGWRGGIVTTGSMEPALRVGSLAFVQPVDDASSVKVGDIIAFRLPDGPDEAITHRVVEVVNGRRGLEFRTRGDSNARPDTELVPAADMIGRVRFSVPYLGYVARRLRHSETLYLLAGTAAGLLGLAELIEIRRRQRHSKGEAVAKG